MKIFRVTLAVLLFGVSNSVIIAQTNNYDGVKFTYSLTAPDSDEEKTSFRVGDEIVIRPKVENGSTEMLKYLVTSNYYLFVFRLHRVGEDLPLPYRTDKSRLLSISEEERGVGLNLMPDPIFPGEILEPEKMNLSDRYSNLPTGQYRLSIEYKTGKTIQVNGVPRRLRLTHDVVFDITN